MGKVIPCNFKKGDDININDCEYQSNEDYIKYSELLDEVIEKSYIDFEKMYDGKNISEQIFQEIFAEINNFNNKIVAIVSQYEENYDFDEISLTPNYILSLLKMEKRKISKKIKSIITGISLV